MLKVGVTADWQPVDGQLSCVLNRDYHEWLRGAGLYPVTLPALPGSEADALQGLSALVLSGGRDIQPRLYGGDPEPLPGETFSHADRSAFEFALVWKAVRLDLPLLGICLGCQSINVALGGDLVRDLHDPKHRHRRPAGPRGANPQHRLHTQRGSLTDRLYPSSEVRVVSSHHQAVGRPAEGFRVTAWGPDRVPEALENPSLPRVLAVQWHPERSPRSAFSVALGKWLRDQAARYAGAAP
jgi:putative glutamine amidotransferase